MICNLYDKNYFEDKSIWVVELSNGEIVYQDDGKNSDIEYSAWIRLKTYILENNLTIKKMYIRFRSNIIYPLEDNAEGYFFSIGIIGMMSSSDNINFYIVGSLKKDKVYIKKIKVPELIVFDEEERDANKCSDNQLILNKKENNGKTTIREQQV